VPADGILTGLLRIDALLQDLRSAIHSLWHRPGFTLAGSLVSGVVFGLTPRDWSHVATAVALMIGVSLTACVVPAIRAARIDPLRAIRHE
jgi:hypothetical protein